MESARINPKNPQGDYFREFLESAFSEISGVRCFALRERLELNFFPRNFFDNPGLDTSLFIYKTNFFPFCQTERTDYNWKIVFFDKGF